MKHFFVIFLLSLWVILFIGQCSGQSVTGASYEEILQDAIERNYRDELQNQEVVFVWKDYIPRDDTEWNEDSTTKNSNTAPRNTQTGTNIWDITGIQNLGQNINISRSDELQDLWFALSDIWAPGNINTITQELPSAGNFWNPHISTKTTQYNEECDGIFFDPCIIIWNLDGQDGDWRLQSSKTPIYKNPGSIR